MRLGSGRWLRGDDGRGALVRSLPGYGYADHHHSYDIIQLGHAVSAGRPSQHQQAPYLRSGQRVLIAIVLWEPS